MNGTGIAVAVAVAIVVLTIVGFIIFFSNPNISPIPIPAPIPTPILPVIVWGTPLKIRSIGTTNSYVGLCQASLTVPLPPAVLVSFSAAQVWIPMVPPNGQITTAVTSGSVLTFGTQSNTALALGVGGPAVGCNGTSIQVTPISLATSLWQITKIGAPVGSPISFGDPLTISSVAPSASLRLDVCTVQAPCGGSSIVVRTPNAASPNQQWALSTPT